MTVKSRLVLALFSLVLANCSMPGDVKDTKNTSKSIEEQSRRLGDTSEKLDQNTDKVAKDSPQINAQTGDIFYGARKDLGFERVDERFKEIVDDKASDADKVLYATAMCGTYEFQQWVGHYNDSPQIKAELYHRALRDLFARLDGLIGHDYNVDTSVAKLGSVELSKSLDNRWKSLASIAVALGEIDDDQATASMGNHIPPESLYSLIVKGLQYKEKYNRGENIPKYAHDVLDYEDEAVFLMQLRHNYFAAMVLSRFSDFSSSHSTKIYLESLLSGFGPSNSVLSGLRPVVPANRAKIEDQGILFLELAQQTQRDLVQLNVPLQFNSAIKTIFMQTRLLIPTAEQTPALAEAVRKLEQKISELRDTYKTGEPAALPTKDASLAVSQ